MKTEFLKRFELLCAEHGMSVRAACVKIGLSSAVSTNWKKGYLPNASTQQTIANYFNITVAELMGLDESGTEPLVDDEFHDLVKAIRRLDKKDIEFVARIVNLLSKGE